MELLLPCFAAAQDYCCEAGKLVLYCNGNNDHNNGNVLTTVVRAGCDKFEQKENVFDNRQLSLWPGRKLVYPAGAEMARPRV